MEELDFTLCDVCKAKEARYSVSIMSGDKVMLRSLCQDCMAKMNMTFSAGSAAKVLGAIMNALGAQMPEESPAPHEVEAVAEDPAPENDAVCENCGTTRAQFLKTGKLGCVDCYTAFREDLTGLLKLEETVHTGRKPVQDEATQQRRSTYERLTWHLQAAIDNEDYETAAVIRDQLRKFDREGGAQD